MNYNFNKRYEQKINFLKKNESGLFLDNSPTGTGKTYEMCKLMYKNKDDMKFYFITPLLKNLPFEELKGFYERNQDINNFEKDVIIIKANSDYILELKNIKDIPAEIKESDEYKELSKRIPFDNGSLDNQKVISEDIREKFEPNFRIKIKSYLNGIFEKKNIETINDKKKYIKEKEQWLVNLYPNIFIDDYKIILLSMKKFLTKNTIIFSTSYYFVDKLKENDVVILDEITDCKKNINDHFIEEASTNSMNTLGVFNNIYFAIKNKNITIIKDLKKLKNESKKIYKCYNLKNSLKSEDFNDNNNFLFQTKKISTISNKNQKFICKKNENTTSICMKDQIDKSSNEFYLSNLLMRISNYFYLIRSEINYNAREYINNKNFNITYEEARNTIKGILNIPNNSFFDEKSKIKVGSFKDTNDYYSRGFNLYELNDDLNHNEETYINSYILKMTAEYWLYKLAKRNKVFGLSATSFIDSVICNFDLSYLKRKLGKNYIIPSHNTEEEIEDYLNQKKETYKKEKIKINVFNGLKEEDDENIEMPKGISQYCEERYSCNLKAIRKFINDDNQKNILIFNSILPSDNKNEFNKECFEKNIERYRNKTNKDVVMHVLDSNDFEDNKRKILEDAANNDKKVIVFTTYKTIGAGQNMQYKINGENSKEEKDFDAIYLGAVSYIIPNLNDNKYGKRELIEYLNLIMSLSQKGELIPDDKNKFLKIAMQRMNGKIDIKKLPNLYNKESVNKAKFSNIVQAVGRITRANNKNKYISIYIEKVDKDIFSENNFNEIYLNPEMQAIKNNIINQECNENERNRKTNMIFNTSSIIENHIKYMHNNEEDQKNYKILREFILKHPVYPLNESGEYILNSSDKIYEEILNKFYFDIEGEAKYFWKESENPNEIEILMNDECSERGFKENNENKTNLNIFLNNNEGLKRYFKDNGYATSFKVDSNKMKIMDPNIFPIYKGYLGEIVGKYIFKNFLEIELHELNKEIFEKFDYKINDSIYVDFKNYNERNSSDESKQIDKIKAKIDKISKCSNISYSKIKVIIVNILTESRDEYSIRKIGNILIIPTLGYIKNNSYIVNDEANKDIKEFIKNEN